MSESKRKIELTLQEQDLAHQELDRLFLYETAFKIPSNAWKFIDESGREVRKLTSNDIEDMHEATEHARGFLSHSLNNPKQSDLSEPLKKMTFEDLLRKVVDRLVEVLLQPVQCTLIAFYDFSSDSESESENVTQKIMPPSETEIRDILHILLRRSEKISAQNLEEKIANKVDRARQKARINKLAGTLQRLESLNARLQESSQLIKNIEHHTNLNGEKKTLVLSGTVSDSAPICFSSAQVSGINTKP